MRARSRAQRLFWGAWSAALLALALGPVAAGCSEGEGDEGDGLVDGGRQNDGAAYDGGSNIPPPPGPLCGNGKLEGVEECDDGNAKNGDGCDSACKIESAGPNDICDGVAIELAQVDASTRWEGSVSGTTTGLFNQYSSTCGGGSGADAVYAFTSPLTGRATVRTRAGYSAILSARTGCADAKSELACAEVRGPVAGVDAGPSAPLTGEIAFPVFANQPAYVFVDGYGGTAGDFELDVEVETAVCGNGKAEFPEECDDGNTTDGDGCSAKCTLTDTTTVSACPGMGYRLAATAAAPGAISFAGDTTNLTNAGGNSVGCTPAGAGPNAVYAITPTVTGSLELSLLANYPDALIHVRRECSDSATQVDCRVAPVARVAAGTSIPVAAEETIYVYVDGHSTVASRGLYVLDAKLSVGACGNGVVDSGEECDDGATVDGDGCSATCLIERQPASYTCPGQPLRLEGAVAGARTIKVRGITTPLAGASTPANKFACGSNAPDVVYQVTSDIDGYVTATVSGDFNTAVGVRTACPGTADLVCDKSGSGNDPDTARFAMNKETPYFVYVDGATAGKTGAFELSLTIEPSVCGNGVVEGGETCDDGAVADGDGCDATCKLETDTARDECATAPIFALDANADGTYEKHVVSGTTNLTKPATPTHSLSPCSSTGPDGYYPFVAPISGVVTATLASATFRSTIGARSGCLPAGAQLTCDGTDSQGGQEIVFTVTEGQTYWLVVAGGNVANSPNQRGRFTMDVKLVPTGCGDTYVNAPEECDDGNTQNGDGCSSTCTVEALPGVGTCPGHAIALTGAGNEVRRTIYTVKTTGLPSNTGSVCGGSGPEGILAITSDIAGTLNVRATADYQTILHARASCTDPTSEIPKSDCSTSTQPVVTATVQKNVPTYVYVDGMNGASGVAKLQITVTP